MSGAYETRLVDGGNTVYERFAIAIVAGSFLAFAIGAGALLEWVPIDGHVDGVPVSASIGGGLLALGAGTGALGVLSRWRGVRTTPDRSPGLAVGLLQTALWTATTGLVVGHVTDLQTIGWLVGGLVGPAVGYLTIASREDVGATVPAAAFVCVAGAVVMTGVITPAWTWEPAGFDVTIPGRVVVPLLSMFGGLLAGRSSAAAYAGFGTRGRQNGAFLLISLVVMLTLSVLAFLLVFVFERGVFVVLENLVIGAGTALFVLVGALVLLVRLGRLTPATAEGTDTLVSFVHLAIASALGLVGLGLAYAIVANRAIVGYAVTIEPVPVVGAVPGAVVGAVLVGVLRRSGSSWVPETDRGRSIDRGIRLAGVLLGGLALIEVFSGSELAGGGIGVVPTAAVVVGGLASAAAVSSVAIRRLRPAGRPVRVPPARTGSLALGAFVVLCVHVAVTGAAIGEPVGIVAGGVDWPFVMNPSQGLGIQKGVMPAMLGTVWIVVGAVVFAVPLAVGAAVFLTEYAEDSLFTRAVDVATNGLWSTPSIVFGLFGLAFLVPRFGGSPSIFAAQLVLGFMLLPLVLITSREAMKSVPDGYRDASAALGVSKWDTIRSVVIPAAMPGVITGAILGVGRIAGETAPLLLVLNGPNFPNSAPGVISGFTVDLGPRPPFVHVSNPALLERASALPYQLYAVITAGVGAEESFGWGTTLVLLGVVLGFFAIGVASRRYFRRKLHQ